MEDNVESEFEVTVMRDGDVAIVTVYGELDAASSPTLEGVLGEARRTAGAMLLDLSDCGFLDSTGLHAIIDARTAIQETGGRFALCCPPQGPIARVIEVALPGMLELYPTRDAALRALR